MSQRSIYIDIGIRERIAVSDIVYTAALHGKIGIDG